MAGKDKRRTESIAYQLLVSDRRRSYLCDSLVSRPILSCRAREFETLAGCLGHLAVGLLV